MNERDCEANDRPSPDGNPQPAASGEPPELEELPEAAVLVESDARARVQVRRRRLVVRRRRPLRRSDPPLQAIWFRPGEAMRGIMDSDSRRMVFPLTALAGVEIALTIASKLELGETLSLPTIIGLALVGGPLLGLGLLYAFGALLTQLCSMLGSQGPGIDVRAALAWAAAPLGILALLWIPQLGLFGSNLFTRGGMFEPALDSGTRQSIIAFLVADVVLWLWAGFIALGCLRQLLGGSTTKTLAVIALGLGSPLAALVLADRVSGMLFAGSAEDGYLVFVEPGPWNVADPLARGEYLAAAEVMADFHEGRVVLFDPEDLDAALRTLKKAPPRFVAFVVPPHEIDVDLCNRILVMAASVDDDPFVDFEYGYITGVGGAGAVRFARSTLAAWDHEYEWHLAQVAALSGAIRDVEKLEEMEAEAALEGEDWSFRSYYFSEYLPDATRRRRARHALSELRGKDAVLCFSHGSPENLAGCFWGGELRSWEIDLSSTILVSCACYNGAVGRWYRNRGEEVVDMGTVVPEESLALAILDSGAAALLAGVDTWHGPLASDVFSFVVNDGMRLGEAAKRMYDRLVLDFLPERMSFRSAMEAVPSEDGTEHLRRINASTILFGDPALRPFGELIDTPWYIAGERAQESDALLLGLGLFPAVDEETGDSDVAARLAWNRVLDYYSLKDAAETGLKTELYEVLDLSEPIPTNTRFRVSLARCGETDIDLRTLQTVFEATPGGGQRLHLRVALDVDLLELHGLGVLHSGLEVELEEQGRESHPR